MKRVLNKRILRDLKNNFFRYFALFLLITLGMYIIIGIIASAEKIISGTEENAKNNHLEDGQFAVFTELTHEQEKEIADMGITLEKMFSFDIEMEDGSVLRIFRNRKNIDIVSVEQGVLADKTSEICLEKRYCEENEINVGDKIKICGNEFTVTGIGSALDYDTPLKNISDASVQSKIFGIGFVSDGQYDALKKTGKTEDLRYAYLLNGRAYHDELKETIKNALLTEFIKAENNPRIKGCANDVVMSKNVGILVGISLIVLLAYVIAVFVIHQIQQESSVIGALYALGAKKSDLIMHYVLLPTLISLAGGIAGTIIGFTDFAMNSIMGNVSYSYYSLPVFETVYPAYLIIYGIVMPPVIAAAVNVLVINKRLSQTALSLIKGGQNTHKGREINLGNMGFTRRFQIRQITREARTSLTVIAGMLFSLLIVVIGLDCYIMCINVKNDSVAHTKFEYMYALKFPEETVPENAEACYMESLSKTYHGYTLDVNIIGIGSDSRYYDAKPEKGENKVVIGSAAAQKYGLKTGDKIILTDSKDDIDYTFTITDTAEYAVNLAVFMDIDSMRGLFGKDDGYYNVLLSDNTLGIDEGRIYSITTRSDIERSADVFTSLMMPMVIMETTVSALVFCVVIFLMMNVMIDRAAFGISLVKIFGFRTNEIHKLYLNGNTAVVAVGAIICIPLSKFIMDKIYPDFVVNVACGMDLAFPWYFYAGLFCAVMAVYFAVNAVLVNKLKKISPAEALKNRE